jgi:hypothetical protein
MLEIELQGATFPVGRASMHLDFLAYVLARDGLVTCLPFEASHMAAGDNGLPHWAKPPGRGQNPLKRKV